MSVLFFMILMSSTKLLEKDLTVFILNQYISLMLSLFIVFLDRNYPRKLWTNFESDKFKERFGEHAVIPIIFKGCELLSSTSWLTLAIFHLIQKKSRVSK